MKRTKQQPAKAVETVTGAKPAKTEDYVPDVNLIARIAALGSTAQYVEAVVTALEHARGTYSPAEDFLENVCLLYSIGKLTPERVDEHLEDFRANLHDTIDTVRHFVHQNPAEFADLCQEIAPRIGTPTGPAEAA